MISVYLGNVGSGKTACAVREIMQRIEVQEIYTNITPTEELKNKNFITLKDEMIFTTKYDKKKDMEMPDKVNVEFWKKKFDKPATVVLDEVHNIMNARKSGSKINVVMTDFLALLRRVLGSRAKGEGELILITQLERRLDPVARDMATNVKYHICHYIKQCLDCKKRWRETSESPETKYKCPNCKSPKLIKTNHKIEVFSFRTIKDFQAWFEFSEIRYYSHKFITDIHKIFGLYNTYSWDNLISKYY